MAWKPKRFRLTGRFDRDGLAAGTIVYDCKSHDYGCASDDTRRTGVEYTSVTFDAGGDYPFFTIPKRLLAEAPRTEDQDHGA